LRLGWRAAHVAIEDVEEHFPDVRSIAADLASVPRRGPGRILRAAPVVDDRVADVAELAEFLARELRAGEEGIELCLERREVEHPLFERQVAQYRISPIHDRPPPG